MSSTLRLVMGDQLSRDVSSLRDATAGTDVILMVEVKAEVTSVKHHKQKIVLVLSAMRHFAESLRAEGFHVDYVALDDPDNTHSFTKELQRAVVRHEASRLVVTEASEWRVHEMMQGWPTLTGVDVVIRADDRFLCSRGDFAAWADGRRSFRMEFFYREMRKKTGLLMQNGKPEGGQWNLDAENRKRLPKDAVLPKRLSFAPDQTTKDVMAMVDAQYAEHFGTLDHFAWAVTRDDALLALDHFIAHSLAQFGDYQDAMKSGEDFIHHSALSPYINIGLLAPREVCDAAESAYTHGRAPLNAAEGFIRQIIGWREYVNGIYWSQMPSYADGNFLNGRRALPTFFWWGEVPMHCLGESIRNTRDNAYAHHIQRLMVIGNFALLAGVRPKDIEEWFLVVYADAFEWVELPNVHGMVMHADGGLLASKPYVASGAYINRMSDYCASCQFDPEIKTGPKACPYSYLYWNFMMEHEAALGKNPRMAMPYRNLQRMPEGQKQIVRDDAARFLENLA